VPLTDLTRDLAARRVPDFSLVVPDNCHNSHDCPVSTADAWLRAFLPPVLASPQMRHAVVFVIFDEGRGHQPGAPGGLVPALAVGPTVRPGSRNPPGSWTTTACCARSRTRFLLPRLGLSARAVPLRGIWR